MVEMIRPSVYCFDGDSSEEQRRHISDSLGWRFANVVDNKCIDDVLLVEPCLVRPGTESFDTS